MLRRRARAADPLPPVASRRRWIIERALPIALLACAMIGAPLMIFSQDGMPRLEAVERELASVEKENDGLRSAIEIQRARVARMRDDPQALEQLARDELGLIRQSEVVFQFPKERK